MITTLDVATLSEVYGSGTVTPRDVVTEVYRRIATGERHVWITLVPQATAMARAKALERLAASHKELPLNGIPFAVKDNIDVAGLPTTAGCPAYAYTPERSATVVQRLEAAGAILIGKTNLDQFATGLVGTRTPYGIPSSIFNSRYISGGSSSGSGVAVASGWVSFALGTDTAGSGRVPAAFNNVVGLKPSKGLVSAAGVVPAVRTQDVVSIFAGTCGDALRVLQVAASFDPTDPFARLAPMKTTLPESMPARFRFGVPRELDFLGDHAGSLLFEDASQRLEALGGIRVPIDLTPFLEAARLLYEGPWVAERLAAIADFAAAHPEDIHPVVKGIILGARGRTAVEAYQGAYQLAALCKEADAQWARMDVLLVPTTPTTYSIDQLLADPVRLNSNLGMYTNFANLMDLSAIAIPAGFRPQGGQLAGLPFGVTLMGHAHQDGRIATLADRLHRSLANPTIGGTGLLLPEASRISAIRTSDRVAVAVVGAHLSGQPLNTQLIERHARLLRTAHTASGYSLFALPGPTPAKPGLVFDGHGAGGIEVEVWELGASEFGSFTALIPPPLAMGTVTLEDGSHVKGFLCEAYAVAGAKDITVLGGWRRWLEQSR